MNLRLRHLHYDRDLLGFMTRPCVITPVKRRESQLSLTVSPGSVPPLILRIMVVAFIALGLCLHFLGVEALKPLPSVSLYVGMGIANYFFLPWFVGWVNQLEGKKGDYLILNKETMSLKLPRVGIEVPYREIIAIYELLGWYQGIGSYAHEKSHQWMGELDIIFESAEKKIVRSPIVLADSRTIRLIREALVRETGKPHCLVRGDRKRSEIKGELDGMRQLFNGAPIYACEPLENETKTEKQQ